MPEPVAYLNGQWLPQSQATLPLNDAGFVMGVTVTDFVRTFHHKLDRLSEHLTRFRQNARDAQIDLDGSDLELFNIALELTRRNAELLTPNQELALILFATPGPIGYYLGDPGNGPGTFGMHTFSLPFERYREIIRRGAWLRVSNENEAMSPRTVPTHIKHRSRMHWWLAEHEVQHRDQGMSRALLANSAGQITETAFANVVIVRGNEIISPRRATLLPGLSLKMIEDLCPEVGLTFHERDLTISDCVAADAMLLCGTAFCLARVERLNDHVLAKNDDAMNRLLHAWNNRVGLDIHTQILG